MATPAQDKSARVGRLNSFLHQILTGQRQIQSAKDAQLFLEAVRIQPVPGSCVENIVASKHGVQALAIAVRASVDPTFIRSQTIHFISYLADDDLKLRANGHVLRSALSIIIKPPLLWRALVDMAQNGFLADQDLQTFSWLCLELLSLPRSTDSDVHGDIEAVVRDAKLLDASCPETRRLCYKIQQVLQLQKSPCSQTGDAYAPGGRHDNDFTDFRQIAIYPTTDEFLSTERPFYRKAKEVSDMQMTQRPAAHIDNMFRLLREDLIGELRNDWQSATNVKTRGKRSVLTLRGLLPVALDVGGHNKRKKVCLSLRCESGLAELARMPRPQRIQWLNDNRSFLRHQAFGALYQGQDIFGFAFVDRDMDGLLASPPVLTLRFTDDMALNRAMLALKTLNDVNFTLVDTPVFAYEPVLQQIKSITEIPLQDWLLDPANVIEASDFAPHPDRVQDILTSFESAGTNAEGLPQAKTSELDDSQQASLVKILDSPVSVTQGPPGTGKSFIGALAVLHILKSTKARVLVMTYTNHAVDQFIEELLDLGVPDSEIVRLGSKSTDRTSHLLISKQHCEYKRSPESWRTINKLEEEASGCSQILHERFTEYMQAQPSFGDIRDYLEFSAHDAHFFDAFQVPVDDDGFETVAKRNKGLRADYLFNQWRAGRGPRPFEQHARKFHKEVWQIGPSERQALLKKWFTAILLEKAERVQSSAKHFDALQDQLDMRFSEKKQQILQNKRIIACTTTAAAMYTSLVSAAQAEVMLVEEAGEIQEPHVLAALTPSVRQLILIGDHKQLRPKINNYDLTVEKGSGYDLNRSLFERLVLDGYPCMALRKQHRMHPDISRLVRELAYPELQDGPKTTDRPPVRGLNGRVIFVNHTHPETQDERITDRRDPGTKSSKENLFEAQMVVKTVRYLAQQGYTTNDMVVLTPYLGQLRLIRDMLGNDIDPLLSDLDFYELIQAGILTKAAANVNKSRLRLSTVDNYQGEEAKIVIVSLARSNNDGDIGFLAAPERVNVLLSRARDCLIIYGNMETYTSSKKGRKTWLTVFQAMKEGNYLHDGLPVHCEKHAQKNFVLKTPDDFDTHCPDGGCAEICGATMSCGLHKCDMHCHRVEDHSKKDCIQVTDLACRRGHKLKVPCHERESQCPKCRQDDLETERRVKRDLKLETDRAARQQAYKQELEKIQDQIDYQQRIIKDQKDEEDHRKTLEKQKADLDALTERAARGLRTPKPKSAPVNARPHAGDSAGSGLDNKDASFTGAQQDWEDMKKEGAKNEVLDKLMDMIGLEEVKHMFLKTKDKTDLALRQDISLQKERFGCALLGNPGTGKTTVARLYAKFMASLAIIPGSCFVEETGASLANAGVAGCKSIIEKILNDGGGVLFIDEAYQLTSGNSPGGGAVLDYLLPEVENLTGKIVFVLAGYQKQMESFFAHNPGLPSRFHVTMKFEDYSNKELLRILELNIWNKYSGRMKCEDGSRGLYCRIVAERLGRGRGKEGFGNARTVENALKVITDRQAARLSKQRRARPSKQPDDFLYTKEDLIGPEPSGALAKSKAWTELQSLTGLKTVKEAVKSLVDTISHNYQRELKEQQIIEYSLNRVLVGNPGTGKTSVAKLYGRILVDLGMLSNGEVIVKNPSDFVGAAMGESEKLTKGILASTVGKVLVIDEAYGLYGGSSNVDIYRTAVIDTIVAEVQSVPGDDRCVLLLGYKNQMSDMFQNVNPGLSRRFPMSSAFEFQDFSQEELKTILELKLKRIGFGATTQAINVAMDMLDRARNRPNFGNAGEIDILLDAAKLKHQFRFSKGRAASASDFDPRDFDEDFDRAERSDTDVAKLFEGTVGNGEAISLLREYQEDVKQMKSLGIDPKENISFNFLFKGPPGTGKTTTAKKMGKVFYDMGFLATAEVIECSATDLIGQYVGQTGPKVQQQLDKALGKVLFVDEAYRLAEGHFAKEAMDELVDAVTKEKYAKKLIIILAGYDKDIDRLMMSNAGLTSRFPEVINFRSLTPDECVTLMVRDLKARQAEVRSKGKGKELDISAIANPNEVALLIMTELFSRLMQVENWASARDVKEVTKSIFRKALKEKAGLERGVLTIGLETVAAELSRMLEGRLSRSTNVSLPHGFSQGEIPHPLPQPAPSPHGAKITNSMASTTPSHYDVQETQSSPPAEEKDQDGDWQHVAVHASPYFRDAIRDAGVSDAVWEQLQKDKIVEQEREEEYQQLLKAQRDAREEDRQKIVDRLLEDEARRQKEAEARAKLAAMRACPAGYNWIRQGGSGYRCAGGSHYMSDAQLQL
ncbi:P-loop containing nucleoside triphosphate hydrolase protein [Coniella lustricola]|uniref:P-loop containing nucleoside triphosphate hydrolase protein n=1 Tax=Coniella lustricola TaxID=2025994 RepID=A0A2T3AGU8_9PEZI|nr:P-loop containing nucleoside triphosphate hydrolase protein [Coniella lustricola]